MFTYCIFRQFLSEKILHFKRKIIFKSKLKYCFSDEIQIFSFNRRSKYPVENLLRRISCILFLQYFLQTNDIKNKYLESNRKNKLNKYCLKTEGLRSYNIRYNMLRIYPIFRSHSSINCDNNWRKKFHFFWCFNKW